MSSGRRGCWGGERSGPTRHTHRPSHPHAKMGSSLARPALWGSQTRSALIRLTCKKPDGF